MERVWLARLTLGIIVRIIYVCVAVPGRNHSVAYFDHVTVLQVLKRRTLVKGGARMWCVNVVSIYEFAHCV